VDRPQAPAGSCCVWIDGSESDTGRRPALPAGPGNGSYEA
jgi:hypothetical protein